MLMEHETSKLKELDESYAKEFKDWKADLKPRKQVRLVSYAQGIMPPPPPQKNFKLPNINSGLLKHLVLHYFCLSLGPTSIRIVPSLCKH